MFGVAERIAGFYTTFLLLLPLASFATFEALYWQFVDILDCMDMVSSLSVGGSGIGGIEEQLFLATGVRKAWRTALSTTVSNAGLVLNVETICALFGGLTRA